MTSKVQTGGDRFEGAAITEEETEVAAAGDEGAAGIGEVIKRISEVTSSSDSIMMEESRSSGGEMT